MATATANLTPTNASDATFRAWGSGISAQLAAMGLVQTGDTGQINWTTVLTPAAVSTSQGYEIWTFNDTLQATAPIYIKIEYGSGITAAANPGLWFTFGTGSNGAGTLTGPISTRQTLTSTAYATNALTCYFSGDTNRFSASLFVQGVGATISNCQYFAFERTKDATGADTDLGLLVTWKLIAGSGSTAWGQLFWNRTTGTPAGGAETNIGAMSNSSSTGKNGTQVAVYPHFLNNAGIFVNPPMNSLSYVNADIVAFGAVSFTIYGASHTYMPIGSASYTGAGLLTRTSGTPTLMMRYE